MLVVLVVILVLVVLVVEALDFCTSMQLIYIRDNYLAVRHHYHNNHYYHHHHRDNTSRSNNVMININDDAFCNDDNAYSGSWCYLGDKKVPTG